jgi:hypothetical protein
VVELSSPVEELETDGDYERAGRRRRGDVGSKGKRQRQGAALLAVGLVMAVIYIIAYTSR